MVRTSMVPMLLVCCGLAAQAPANPGSWRRFDWADGIYIGAIARVTPLQYVRVSGSGVELGAGVSDSTQNFVVGTGATGTFGTTTGQTVTVQDGIIINIF